jgi:uncharacterized protein YwgA
MIDITLSNLGEGNGVFHDLRYTNDNYGGNQNQLTLTVNNISGNPMLIELEDEDGRAYHLENTKKVTLNITGGIEAGEFLNMLRLILETEKIVDILK